MQRDPLIASAAADTPCQHVHIYVHNYEYSILGDHIEVSIKPLTQPLITRSVCYRKHYIYRNFVRFKHINNRIYKALSQISINL